MIYKDFSTGRFYNADCFEVMKEIPDNVIDMVITSSPYDELRTYDNKSIWNFEIFSNIAKELTRIIKEGSAIVWIINDETKNGSESGTSFKQALFFKEKCNLNLHDTMIWNKNEFYTTNSIRYAPAFEYMFIFTKGKLKTFNPIKDRINKSFGRKKSGTFRQKDGSTIIRADLGNIVPEYGQRSNVWEINAEKSRIYRFHPAMFPVGLIEDHIKSWSNEKDCILDCFGGSGTTAIAAINTNRKWVCIEINSEYYDKAIKRIQEHNWK